MAKASNARVKAAAIAHPVPQTRDDVVNAIAEIGRRQRERDRIQAEMNDELAAIKQTYEEQARPHGDAISQLATGVQTWCEANRATLTQDGKIKTANMASGEVRWRLRPPSVLAKPLDKVLEALKDMGLKRFIRVKEELDKEAILADPEAVKHIKGIKVDQKEDFVIVPFETELEEVA